MKFHTDENVSEAVALALRRRGLNVTTTPEAGLRGATDEAQLAYGLRKSRVVVSHDADMLRLAAAGTPHAGIIYCPVRKCSVGRLVSKLLAVASRVAPDKMVGRIEFV